MVSRKMAIRLDGKLAICQLDKAIS
jgi:hypothetical protein